MNERERLIQKIEAKERDRLVKKIEGNKLPISKEQHKDVGFLDRFAIKNLDFTAEEKAKYLNEKGFDVSERGGQTLVKREGDKEWAVIDPSGFDMQDITDVAGIVPESIAQVVGSTLGAVGGTAVAPGVGTIAGLLGGGAASGAAVETAKQGIKRLIGASDEFDGSKIGTSALAAGITAPLVGAGSSIKGLAPGALKMFAEKGALGSAWNATTRKAGPKVAEFLSGGSIPAKVWRTYTKSKEEIAKIAKSPLKAMEKMSKDVVKGVKDAKKPIQAYYDALDPNIPVDLTGVAAKFKGLTDEAINIANKSEGNPALVKQAKDMIAAYEKNFATDAGAPLTESTRDVAHSLKKTLSDALNKSSKGTDTLSGIVTAGYADAKNSIDDAILTGIEKAQGPKAATEWTKANAKYRELNVLEQDANKLFKSPKGTPGTKTGAALNRSEKQGQGLHKDLVKRIEETTGVPLKKNAEKYNAYSLLDSPATSSSMAGRIGGGAMARLALGAGAGAGFGGPVGSMLGAGIGMVGTTPGMLKQYFTKGHALEQLLAPIYKKTAPGAIKSAWEKGME